MVKPHFCVSNGNVVSVIGHANLDFLGVDITISPPGSLRRLVSPGQGIARASKDRYLGMQCAPIGKWTPASSRTS
eukprot:3662575-Rhodomonas_salina.2